MSGTDCPFWGCDDMATATAQILLQYPAKFSPNLEGGYTVTFRDLPEAAITGEDETVLTEMAAHALRRAAAFYQQSGKMLPSPSASLPDERMVRTLFER
jgi:antitoxin HicB